MATRDELYVAVGRALELAQLFEIELGTALLALDALETKSYLNPEADVYLRLRNSIESQTLGKSLNQIKRKLSLNEDLESLFQAALDSRNTLAHHFFPKHGLKVIEAEGRNKMVADALEIQSKLQRAYSVARHISELLVKGVLLLKKAHEKNEA